MNIMIFASIPNEKRVMMIQQKIVEFINTIRAEKSLEPMIYVDESMSLRDDLDLQSLDLATLTVKIEDEFDVDVFEKGLIQTFGEVVQRVKEGVS